MKILVIDSQGKAGHVVSLYMQEQGHGVTGYSEALSGKVQTIVGSLYDTGLIQRVVGDGDYDAVINCSAIINQFAEDDKAAASFINTYLPHFLAKITAGTQTVLVHRSTDCVFSGRRGNYGADDVPDAASFYARTKAVGEVINNKDITIRTSLIGPEYEKEGIGLFNWYHNRQGDVSGFANARWTGLTTIEFAREVESLLLQHAHGLFHLVPEHAISKYDLLLLFQKHFPGDRNVLRVENSPVDKSLLQVLNGYDISVPDYESMIEEMAAWISSHKELYPHYN